MNEGIVETVGHMAVKVFDPLEKGPAKGMVHRKFSINANFYYHYIAPYTFPLYS